MKSIKIDRVKVYNKCGGRCAYCGRAITLKEMQVDHMHPKCQKSHIRHYGIEDINCLTNLMPTCRKCNHYKRGDTLQGFRVSMTDLHERLHKIYIVEVAVNFGMADIKPFNGVFYFETLKLSNQ